MIRFADIGNYHAKEAPWMLMTTATGFVQIITEQLNHLGNSARPANSIQVSKAIRVARVAYYRAY